ncbi:hypothetical protein BDQ12DRAFT_700051 [Crucibulum laeve]|uniref:Nephrocystin 3-like N-terminal domain-containing protein n=1 Tax=Crucibulum laeve TaxID=68775 RepID=A0A5C3LQD3_9AGAR|nr:hypothetical protein BDQ12DRAFT_700051 [Crucibulum laeve]
MVTFQCWSAFHNSNERFDPPKCHPQTRKVVLESIMAWINDRTRVASIMWLCGPAGAGKSAIAQTLSERCEANYNLGASFFFSRTDPKRNCTKNLIPTIAYQLMLAIPPLKPLVTGAAENDRTIFSRKIAVQLEKLIIEPLLCLKAQTEHEGLPENWPQVIIIDGLDECSHQEVQADILNTISNTLNKWKFPLCFLITSRPEQAIRDAFQTEAIKSISVQLNLDGTFNPDKDIKLFICSKFLAITETHAKRPFPVTWPSKSDVNTLVERSSGQFIYAAVMAMKI